MGNSFLDALAKAGQIDKKEVNKRKQEQDRREKEAEKKNLENVRNQSKSNNQRSGQGKQGGFKGKGKKVSAEYNGNYVSAPYNFVPFYNEVVAVDEAQMKNRVQITDELLSGEISYSYEAKTPVFVDDGQGYFFKNEYGKYALPGSTVRGMIRSNAQILGLADFEQDIDDYHLMYRNVAAGANKDFYNDNLLGAGQIMVDGKTMSILKNVAAGYLKNEGGTYYIYKCVIEQIRKELYKMNYYVLNERSIQKKIDTEEFSYFKTHPGLLQHYMENPFKKFEEEKKKTKIIHYRSIPENSKEVKDFLNESYEPYYITISYELKNSKNVTAVGEPGKYKNEGYLVGTGAMQEKKALYIVPAINEDESLRIKIPEADIKAYQIDFEKKKNTLKSKFKNHPEQLERFYGLPKAGEVRPVFYIQLERLYFGPTPRLRVFYAHSVKEGLKQKQVDYDLVKSIFGMSNEKTGYKSKVSFSDAIAYEYSMGKESKKILAEPKATSYLDYLKQKVGENVSTYNGEFELRGVKQYWLHSTVSEEGVPGENKEVGSAIRPLTESTCFEGKVRFNNLTEAELGLLVWAIRLKEESCVNIGKAKAYGYGVMQLKALDVKVLDTKRAYSADLDTLCADIYDKKDAEQLIQGYKSYMKDCAGVDLDKLDHIKKFFMMKDGTQIPDNELTRYMHLGDEYRKRTNACLPLKNIEDIIQSGKK